MLAAIESTRGSDIVDEGRRSEVPLGGVTDSVSPTVSAPMTPSVVARPVMDEDEWIIVTEAREVRKKARKDAPWIQVSNVDRLSRGSAELALSKSESC